MKPDKDFKAKLAKEARARSAKDGKAKSGKDGKVKSGKDRKAKPAESSPLRRLDPFVVPKPDWLFERDILQEELLKASEFQKLLWFSRDETRKSQDRRTMRAMDLYRGLKPIDVGEGMLALQMVGSHLTSLECMYRAADPKLTFEQRAQAITLTNKLMALHLRQMAALDQHRKNKLAEIAVPGWGEALFHEEMRDVETNPNFGAHGPLFYPRARSPVVKSKPEPRAPSPPPTGRKSPPPSARKATF